jgi:pyruvate/2-oxoglutarate/acetoin dehydrogenase E1 component
VQVIDLISLKPFDMETISKSIKKTRKALIVEECMKTGGIGASLSAVINESLFDELDHQVRNTSCNMLCDMRALMCLQSGVFVLLRMVVWFIRTWRV